jgi:hypothetical protein
MLYKDSLYPLNRETVEQTQTWKEKKWATYKKKFKSNWQKAF